MVGEFTNFHRYKIQSRRMLGNNLKSLEISSMFRRMLEHELLAISTWYSTTFPRRTIQAPFILLMLRQIVEHTIAPYTQRNAWAKLLLLRLKLGFYDSVT